MKKVILCILSLSIISCNKGNEPKPSTLVNKTTNTSLVHKLVITDNTNGDTNLYINGIRRSNSTDTVEVKTNDLIEISNVGPDTWDKSGKKTDGYLSVKATLDGVLIFDVSGYLDVDFFKKIK